MKKIKPIEIEVVAPIETWNESTLAFLVGATVNKVNEIIALLNGDSPTDEIDIHLKDGRKLKRIK